MNGIRHFRSQASISARSSTRLSRCSLPVPPRPASASGAAAFNATRRAARPTVLLTEIFAGELVSRSRPCDTLAFHLSKLPLGEIRRQIVQKQIDELVAAQDKRNASSPSPYPDLRACRRSALNAEARRLR
jgi:hypothetical protein